MPLNLENMENSDLLFYPCSGGDWLSVFKLYADRASSFVFSDLGYQFNKQKIAEFTSALLPNWLAQLDTIELVGPAVAFCKQVRTESTSSYREIESACLRVNFYNRDTGRKVLVIWRRGFGQYALHELPDASVKIFCHRGDSSGDGGSNVFFFSNRIRRHAPLSKLYSTLKTKLMSRAFVVSDGSNASLRHLRNASEGKLAIGYELQIGELKWTLQSEVPWEHKSHYGRCYEWIVEASFGTQQVISDGYTTKARE